MKRITVSIALISVIVFQIACAGIGVLVASFKGALAIAGPYIDSRVSDPVRAAAIRKDFSDWADVAAVLGSDLDAATTGIQRIAAVDKAEHQTRVIYARGDFGANADILAVADIADGIMSSIVAYYKPSLVPGASRQTEKQFVSSIKNRIDALKLKLKAG